MVMVQYYFKIIFQVIEKKETNLFNLYLYCLKLQKSAKIKNNRTKQVNT